MSLETVAEILARALEDEEFRSRLLKNPVETLAGYDLSPAETAAFVGGELRTLVMLDPSQKPEAGRERRWRSS